MSQVDRSTAMAAPSTVDTMAAWSAGAEPLYCGRRWGAAGCDEECNPRRGMQPTAAAVRVGPECAGLEECWRSGTACGVWICGAPSPPPPRPAAGPTRPLCPCRNGGGATAAVRRQRLAPGAAGGSRRRRSCLPMPEELWVRRPERAERPRACEGEQQRAQTQQLAELADRWRDAM